MLDHLLHLCDRLHAARLAAVEASWVLLTIARRRRFRR